jgi:hypothetical protein
MSSILPLVYLHFFKKIANNKISGEFFEASPKKEK